MQDPAVVGRVHHIMFETAPESSSNRTSICVLAVPLPGPASAGGIRSITISPVADNKRSQKDRAFEQY